MTGAIVLLGAMLSIFSPASAAPPPVLLGTAEPFAVLAGQAVTNTGPSVINGDVGVHPGTAVVGLTGPPEGQVNGEIHAADAVALQAKADLLTAYNDAAGRSAEAVATELGGETFFAGVYGNSTELGVTGTVTLDAENDPDAVWIFQAGSTLTTAVNSTVALINGADPCNVFWQVGSSATLFTDTTFVGTILALTSISVQSGTTVTGRALARNGSVTLDNNVFNLPECAPPTTTAPTTTSTAPTTTSTAPTTTTTAPTTTTTTAPTTTTGPTTTTAPTTTTGTSTTTSPTTTAPTTTAPTTTSTAPTTTTGTSTTTTAPTTTTGTSTSTTGTSTSTTGTSTSTTGTSTSTTGTSTGTTGTSTTGTTTDTTDTTDTSTSTRTTRSGGGNGGGGGGGGNGGGGGGLAYTGTTLPTMSLAGIGAGIALIGTGLVLMPRRTRAKHA